MRIVLFLAFTVLPGLAFALMPPHWNSIDPSPGSTITSRVITIQGYTLANARLKITDGDGKPVPFSTEVDCAWEGKGDMPGAQQQRCTLVAKLMGELKPGTKLTVDLFGNKAEYTVGDPKTAPAPNKPAVPGGK